MTDGIGRLTGYGNYGVGGYVPHRREEAPQNAPAQQQPAVHHQETQVDPSKVMEFMANNNIFITSQPVIPTVKVGAAYLARILSEHIYQLVMHLFFRYAAGMPAIPQNM